MKKQLIPALALIVLGGATIGAVEVFAAPKNNELASRLALRLGMETSEVQDAMQEVREERRAQRHSDITEQLQTALDQGDITQNQYNEIVAHRENMESIVQTKLGQDSTREEIREQMEASRDEFRDWLEGEGIDLHELIDMPHRGRFAGHAERGFSR